MEQPLRIAVLGSSGSIGRQALDVARSHPDRIRVVALVGGRRRDEVVSQAREFGARASMGTEAAIEAASADDVDLVLNAVVGAAGLRATVAALEAGKVVALANKESLVAGGTVCLDAAARGGGTLRPVDSEHAALAQCLESAAPGTVRRVVITASGGPFRTRADLSDVRREEALAHPTWSMGPKITVDCATLMNKGLEVIEAHYLFGLDYDALQVLVHPQSIVHALVELIDGSMLMQAAVPDMRLPIQAALLGERVHWDAPSLDLASVARLDFEPLDEKRFPAVALAYEAGRRGGSYPAALNAANEEAVAAFLDERLAFTGIVDVVEDVLAAHAATDAATLEAVLDADRDARELAVAAIERRSTIAAGKRT